MDYSPLSLGLQSGWEAEIGFTATFTQSRRNRARWAINSHSRFQQLWNSPLALEIHLLLCLGGRASTCTLSCLGWLLTVSLVQLPLICDTPPPNHLSHLSETNLVTSLPTPSLASPITDTPEASDKNPLLSQAN